MSEETKAPEKAAPAPKLVKARVLRDFWPTENDEDRVRAGQVVEVTKDALIEGLEAGVLERVKE
jgi:hypothetical protein